MSLHYFRFPFKRPEILQKCLSALKRVNFAPSKFTTICSEHFEACAFVERPNIIRPYLKDDAVPTIFKGFPPHLQKKAEISRSRKRRASVEINISQTLPSTS